MSQEALQNKLFEENLGKIKVKTEDYYVKQVPQEYGSSASGKSDVQGYGKNPYETLKVPVVKENIRGQDLHQLGMDPDNERRIKYQPKFQQGHVKPCKDYGFSISDKIMVRETVRSHQSGYKDTITLKPHNDLYCPSSKDVKNIKFGYDKVEKIIDNKDANEEAVRWKAGYQTVPGTKPKGALITLQRDPKTLIKEYPRGAAHHTDTSRYAGYQGQEAKWNAGEVPKEQGK